MQNLTQSQATSATLPPFMPHYQQAESLAELSDIYQPHMNLCWYPRDFSPALTQFIEAYMHSKPAPIEAKVDLQQPDLESYFKHLSDSVGREAFIDDLNFICQLYGDLLETDRAGLRLAYLDSTMCPKFHVDRVGVRLLCTYYGQATEWLSNDNIDRSWLGNRASSLLEMEQCLIHDARAIHRLPTGSIGLLKGESDEHNTGNGIVHRSPAITPSQPRLLLSLDALQ